MDMLDAEDRSLLLMKYRDDMSIEDLREILQLSGTSATKMRLKRARDRLRKLYQQEFPDEDEVMEQ
jgi:RNA polymerase sigma-70 factor (ECF subfamily)